MEIRKLNWLNMFMWMCTRYAQDKVHNTCLFQKPVSLSEITVVHCSVLIFKKYCTKIKPLLSSNNYNKIYIKVIATSLGQLNYSCTILPHPTHLETKYTPSLVLAVQNP